MSELDLRDYVVQLSVYLRPLVGKAGAPSPPQVQWQSRGGSVSPALKPNACLSDSLDLIRGSTAGQRKFSLVT